MSGQQPGQVQAPYDQIQGARALVRRQVWTLAATDALTAALTYFTVLVLALGVQQVTIPGFPAVALPSHLMAIAVVALGVVAGIFNHAAQRRLLQTDADHYKKIVAQRWRLARFGTTTTTTPGRARRWHFTPASARIFVLGLTLVVIAPIALWGTIWASDNARALVALMAIGLGSFQFSNRIFRALSTVPVAPLRNDAVADTWVATIVGRRQREAVKLGFGPDVPRSDDE